jgi:HK97 family phage portal protein
MNLKGGFDINWYANHLEELESENKNSITDPMRQHAWFNIGLSKIAKNIARARWVVTNNGEEVPDTDGRAGMAVKLFRQPNPTMTITDFIESICSWYVLNEVVITFGRGDYTSGIPETLWVWNPHTFEAVLSKNEDAIVLWRYREKEKEIVFLPSEVIHIKPWNKWNYWRGAAIEIPVKEEMNQDYKGNRSNSNLLDNNAIIPGVLKSDIRLTDEQAKEIKERWKREHPGFKNHYNPIILGQGMEYQQIAVTPKDMNYGEMKTWNRETILALLNVPLELCGIGTEGAPLSGERFTAAMKMFWSLTLFPILNKIQNKFKVDFFDRLGLAGYQLTGDTKELPELQEDKNAAADLNIKLVSNGLTTINRVLEESGQQPVPWGDTWWKPFSLQPVDAEQPAPEPATEAGTDEGAQEEEPSSADEGKSLAEFMGKSAARPSRTKTLYTPIYRNKHWWGQINAWENIETSYAKQLKAWFQDQRARFLTELFGGKGKALEDVLFSEAFWTDELEKLKALSNVSFTNMLEAVGNNLKVLFDDLNLNVSYNIYDTRAPQLLKNRVNKGKLQELTDTVKDTIREEMKTSIEKGETESERADRIRAVYNAAKSRAPTIARTELGGVISDSREESFRHVGFKNHSWLSAQDAKVREGHNIDGETVKIGEKFSNGLTRPHDPNGDAGDVINCRCLTLPED